MKVNCCKERKRKEREKGGKDVIKELPSGAFGKRIIDCVADRNNQYKAKVVKKGRKKTNQVQGDRNLPRDDQTVEVVMRRTSSKIG